MKICVCNATLNNTGTPGCKVLMRDADMVIFVPQYGSAGTLNTIDLTVTLNQAYFDGKVNHSNPLDRWYPVPRLKNAESERGEAEYKEYDDKTKDFVRQGIRSYSFLLNNQEPALLGKLEQWRCQPFGFFIIDKNRSLIGMTNTSTTIRPIIVDNNNFNAVYMIPKASDVASIQMTFNFDVDEQDADLIMILASEISPVNLQLLKGLLDVNVTYSAITTAGLTAKLFLDYGSALNPDPVTGLLITDFFDVAGGSNSKVYNVTDVAALALVSVTEGPSGTYVLTWIAESSGDKIRVTPVKTGFDFTRVIASLATLP